MQAKVPSPNGPKKPYVKPALIVHGDVAKLTQHRHHHQSHHKDLGSDIPLLTHHKHH